MSQAPFQLIEFLRPLLVTRLVNVHDHWVERVGAYQFQPQGLKMAPLLDEAQQWVSRTAFLQANLSPEHIIAAVEKLPKREFQILEGRSQGKVYKELAFELGISITRVRTLYLKGIKRCFQFVLEADSLDQLEFEPQLGGLALEDFTSEGRVRRIWQVVEAILRQRLGRGSHMALQRLKVEVTATDPQVLHSEIADWLKQNFSQLTANQFVKALG